MSENDLTNREFGDYHILRRIGSGAMAEVYLAEQRSLGRRVALKILKPELAADETYLKRFIREARAIAKLVHPNLVQIYQADSFENYWYIAQEYVPGQTLLQMIRRAGPLPARQMADILWQIASALDCAAESGIVHRDVKPDNVLLGDNGDVKIADFGLARVNDPNQESSLTLTQVGMTLGTPLYMSPEQAQGKTLDHRSDMYSLGITCYHALTGQPPFRGETALAVALQHVNNTPQPLEELRPDLPPPLVRLVHRMIEKEPDDRFQSFHDIQSELRALFKISFHDEEAAGRLTDWNRFRVGETDEMLLVTTEKLQRLMLRERELRRGSRWRRIVPILLPLLMLLGTAFGYWRVYSMPSPLHEPKGTQIRKRDTVEEQWVFASLLNTPAAWNSVIDYFPKERYWTRKAKRQLIRYYFHRGESGDTTSPVLIFQEFAEFSDVDVDDQALGLAGLAWCSAENQDDMKIPMEYLRQLFDLSFSDSDTLLIQILDATQKTIQQKNEASSR